jgi:hypothetical protein
MSTIPRDDCDLFEVVGNSVWVTFHHSGHTKERPRRSVFRFNLQEGDPAYYWAGKVVAAGIDQETYLAKAQWVMENYFQEIETAKVAA